MSKIGNFIHRNRGYKKYATGVLAAAGASVGFVLGDSNGESVILAAELGAIGGAIPYKPSMALPALALFIPGYEFGEGFESATEDAVVTANMADSILGIAGGALGAYAGYKAEGTKVGAKLISLIEPDHRLLFEEELTVRALNTGVPVILGRYDSHIAGGYPEELAKDGALLYDTLSTAYTPGIVLESEDFYIRQRANGTLLHLKEAARFYADKRTAAVSASISREGALQYIDFCSLSPIIATAENAATHYVNRRLAGINDEQARTSARATYSI